MACNHQCNQGRECTCYRANFDHVGQSRAAELRTADLIICIIAIAVIAALFSGVL